MYPYSTAHCINQEYSIPVCPAHTHTHTHTHAHTKTHTHTHTHTHAHTHTKTHTHAHTHMHTQKHTHTHTHTHMHTQKHTHAHTHTRTHTHSSITCDTCSTYVLFSSPCCPIQPAGCVFHFVLEGFNYSSLTVNKHYLTLVYKQTSVHYMQISRVVTPEVVQLDKIWI